MGLGLEIRASIDTENVKALLLINGGGAVALLAFLPSILGVPEYMGLVRAVIWGLLLFQVGLVAAVTHNHLRRRCSLAWEAGRESCTFRGRPVAEPCICYWSQGFMVLSVLGFVIASVVVVVGALDILNTSPQVQPGIENVESAKVITPN